MTTHIPPLPDPGALAEAWAVDDWTRYASEAWARAGIAAGYGDPDALTSAARLLQHVDGAEVFAIVDTYGGHVAEVSRPASATLSLPDAQDVALEVLDLLVDETGATLEVVGPYPAGHPFADLVGRRVLVTVFAEPHAPLPGRLIGFQAGTGDRPTITLDTIPGQPPGRKAVYVGAAWTDLVLDDEAGR